METKLERRLQAAARMRTKMMTADVPDTVLQKILGHKSAATTDIYDPFQLESSLQRALPSRPAVDEFWSNSTPRNTLTIEGVQ